MPKRIDPYVTGIYRIVNTINGHMYIGKSVDIYHRFKEHREGRRSSEILQAAFSKYGINNFIFEVIEECSKEELSEKEKFWIKAYNSTENGYNISPGGRGGDTISHLPKDRYDAHIEKLSKPRPAYFSVEQAKRSTGCKWVNNGIERKFAKGERLEELLSQGYVYGSRLCSATTIEQVT